MITSINSYSPQLKNRTFAKNPQAQSQQNFSGRSGFQKFFNRQPEDVNHTLNKLDNWFIKLADNKAVKNVVEWASKTKTETTKEGHKKVTENSDKLAQYLMVGYSAFLQTNHVINIMKNKQMPEERKETLAVNNILAFILPTIGAFTIDNSINKGTQKFVKYLKELNGPKINDKALSGVKAAQSLLIFTMMYKYASTIVTTPMADTTTKWLHKKGLLPSDRKAKKVAESEKTSNKERSEKTKKS